MKPQQDKLIVDSLELATKVLKANNFDTAKYINLDDHDLPELAQLAAKAIQGANLDLVCKVKDKHIILKTGTLDMFFAVENTETLLKDFKAVNNYTAPRPSKPRTGGYELTKNRYFDKAKEFNDLAEVQAELTQAQENHQTALTSGNKALIEVMAKELAKWADIAGLAETIDYTELNLNKEAEANPEIQKYIAHNADFTARKLFDLFRAFNIAPVNDAKLIETLQLANELRTEGKTVDQRIDELSQYIITQETEAKVKYYKLNGDQKSLSYGQRKSCRVAEQRIENIKEQVIQLRKKKAKLTELLSKN